MKYVQKILMQLSEIIYGEEFYAVQRFVVNIGIEKATVKSRDSNARY